MLDTLRCTEEIPKREAPRYDGSVGPYASRLGEAPDEELSRGPANLEAEIEALIGSPFANLSSTHASF